jgi:probable addiction module antidote protein
MTKTVAMKAAKTKTTAYDVAEHLRTPEEMAAYLDAWLEEAPDDAAGIARALGDIARAKGMSQVAKDAGLRGCEQIDFYSGVARRKRRP